MSNPSKDLRESESSLRIVIEKLIDSQEGFEKIGEAIAKRDLKDHFLAETLKRAQFRGDLEAILHQDGVHDVKESGTAAGKFVRAWGDLKAMLGGGDHALLTTADEIEDAVRQAYSDALDVDLPLPVRQKLTSQYAHVLASQEFIRAGRDSRANQDVS